MMPNILTPEQQARQLAAEGQYRAAVDLLHLALRQHANHETWALWAGLQLNLGNEEQATEGYRQALNLKPSEKSYEICLDDLWKRSRIRQRVAADIEHGQSLLRQEHPAEAAQVLQQVLAQHETAELWNDWASAMFLQGHGLEAEGGFRRALALDPAHRTAAGNLGLLLYQNERAVEALPWLRRGYEQAAGVERAQWQAALIACQAAVQEPGGSPASPSGMAEVAQALLRLQEHLIHVRTGLKDVQRQLPPPASANDESGEFRTLLEPRPLGQMVPAVTEVRLCDAATVASPLPLVDRWLLGTLAALYGRGEVLHWGAKNAITLDLAANAGSNASVWHVADAVPGFDPLEPARLDSHRTGLAACIQSLPVQSPGFDLKGWVGRMSLVVIESQGTAEQVRDNTSSALPFLATHSSVAVWFGYGRWKGVTWALNELYLAEPGFDALVHATESNLALLIRPPVPWR